MAAKKTNESSKLILKVETGKTSGGEAAYSSRTISNVSPSLSTSDALAVGNALGALQTYPVGGVVRQDTAYLVEE